jgi:DNA-binding beta-propeller fold protein YncE
LETAEVTRVNQSNIEEESRLRRNAIILLLVLAALLLLWRATSRPPTGLEDVRDPGVQHRLSIFGYGKEWIREPNGVAYHDGRLYVADTGNHRGLVFDRRGRPLFKFGERQVEKGVEDDKLLSPLNIAVAPNGDIWVTQMIISRISIFDKAGKFKKSLEIDRPIQIVNEANRMYITTQGQVAVLDLDGNVLEEWGEFGQAGLQFAYPNGLALDDKGNMFVVDSQNHRIQILSKKGELIGGVGAPAKDMNDSNRLFGLGAGAAFDNRQRLFVVDSFHHAVRVFSYDGEDYGRMGSQGYQDGRFNYPAGIAHMGGDTFAVADKWNDRVQVVRLVPEVDQGALTERARRVPFALVVGTLLLLLLLLLLLMKRRRGAGAPSFSSGPSDLSAVGEDAGFRR